MTSGKLCSRSFSPAGLRKLIWPRKSVVISPPLMELIMFSCKACRLSNASTSSCRSLALKLLDKKTTAKDGTKFTGPTIWREPSSARGENEYGWRQAEWGGSRVAATQTKAKPEES